MLEIRPGCEDDFRSLRAWLAASAALDRLIEATEPLVEPPPDLPLPLLAAAHRRAPSGKARARPSLRRIPSH